MTQFYNTSTTPITIGIKTWTCGFQPVGALITVIKPSSSAVIKSTGYVDSTGWVDHDYEIDDGVIRELNSGGGANGKAVSLHTNVGGLSTETNAASFNGGAAFTATGFQLNVTNVTVAAQYKIRLWG